MKRRAFLKRSASIMALPTVVSSVAVGQNSANGKINIGQIGFGRIARTHDLPEIIKHDMCRVVAVADFDTRRGQAGKTWVERYYQKKTGSDRAVGLSVYQDYREMLQDKSIDAVIISTPDHWHAQPAMEAALAGKDIYLQKPASLTIAEGRRMSDVVHRTGRIFQVGSQQRSVGPWPQFHRACELIRNGRVGELIHIEVGLGTDPGCGEEPRMPVPKNLDYDMWLGSTPRVPYTEKRVHPQADYSRPGWLRCRQFGAGMITGWGAHHLDTAQWAMGTEYSGPVEIEAEAVFPDSGLWSVHGDFDVHAKYASGVTMHISSQFTNGVRFKGTEGWIFVSRGDARVTSSDPGVPDRQLKRLDASDQTLLDAPTGPNAIHLYRSPEQHLNWLNCIKNRRQPIAPVEVAHRSCSVCLVSHIAMQVPGKLYWDPKQERFADNDQANGMLSRPQRFPYGTDYVKV